MVRRPLSSASEGGNRASSQPTAGSFPEQEEGAEKQPAGQPGAFRRFPPPTLIFHRLGLAPPGPEEHTFTSTLWPETSNESKGSPPFAEKWRGGKGR